MLSRFAVAIALVIAAPAAAQQESIISNPAIGEETTVPAGGEVYSFIRLFTVPAYQIDADTKAGNWLLEAMVQKGTKLVPVETRKPAKGCVPAVESLTAVGPCFIDDDGDGSFDRHSADEVTMFRKLKSPVPYSRTNLTISREDSLKRVILYQGAAADSLRFSYREFKNDMARPAFTEELTVPREPFPAMIMLKNLQVEVLKVSGMGMTYRVVKAM